ncbi:transcriptional regulator, AraC family [Paracoccus solventivorans]|uniref:Transcriptional regulator, AraC family n=1 Tax=Paracoccus solventivorans TaxID=53463 RepID=A0A1M7D838_9RHOB|nr:AraC family transcriptional regulator [Paracoccus solventivorans]SHL75588.1 transcriptional regulator, AraC family [Paracoccus solventivorans]
MFAQAPRPDPELQPPANPAAAPAGVALPDPANLPRPTAPLRPYAGRPLLPGNGLRLLPLDSFAWGGPAGPARARRGRTRGDHCLIRVTAGTLRITLPRGPVDHGADSVVFIPAGTAFAAEPQPGVCGQVLLMPRDLGERLDLPLPNRIVATLADSAAGDTLSADLRALAQRLDDPEGIAAGLRLGLIAGSLRRMVPAGAKPGRRPPPDIDDRQLVGAYRELAGRELGRGRTVADLAEALGVSAAGLDAACRRHRGCSALALLYELRLERATTVLRSTDRPLAEIAAELGFTGTAHLIRSFITATGRTPENYRQMARASSAAG